MGEQFTIGILETGLVPEELVEKHSSYPDMFTNLLQSDVPTDWKFRAYSPVQGDFPGDVMDCDAWLITGSKFGAYEDYDWIHRLRGFLTEAYEKDRAIVGICFGHQILAEALGGKVIKSSKGWGCGAHVYDWTDKPDWMQKAEQSLPSREEGSFAIQAYHQDQVVDLPRDANVIAKSDFCYYAALAYQDKAISFQGHPEFSPDYSSDLFSLRKGVGLPDDVADAAIATKEHPLDREVLAKAVVEFLLVYQANRTESEPAKKAG
ncbi:MAG TPA: GMP synthase [Rhizobiales bacterium]|nr:GMP synthase [Hyphomicrobiales bacterium]